MPAGVTDGGEIAGKEIVQLYVRDLFASITPPVKRPHRFEKVEPGSFKVLVGRLNALFAVS